MGTNHTTTNSSSNTSEGLAGDCKVCCGNARGRQDRGVVGLCWGSEGWAGGQRSSSLLAWMSLLASSCRQNSEIANKFERHEHEQMVRLAKIARRFPTIDVFQWRPLLHALQFGGKMFGRRGGTNQPNQVKPNQEA